jgi:hypothetical protein
MSFHLFAVLSNIGVLDNDKDDHDSANVDVMETDCDGVEDDENMTPKQGNGY